MNETLLNRERILRVLTIPKAPFVFYNEQDDSYSGFLIDLLEDISKEVKFKYKIEQQKDEQIGCMDTEGNWNGMIGELKDRKIDIGLGAVSLMSERMKVVDFTEPIYKSSGISVLMQKSPKQEALFRFLSVLDSDVWFCIIGSYLLTSVLLWIYDVWSPYSYRNTRGDADKSPNSECQKQVGKPKTDERIFTLKESLWFCLTSLTPQGGGEAPRNLSGRLVAATWWLFGFIIIASYTANLAAYLTIAKHEKSIETFEDLISQYRYSYTAIQNSSTYRYFQRMKEIEYKFYETWKDMTLNDSLTPYERAQLAVWEYPLSDKFIKIYSAINQNKKIWNFSQAMSEVTTPDSKFALLTEATDVQYQVMINCELKEVGPEFSKKPYAIALQKNSHLTKKFDEAIYKMQRTGFLNKLEKKWWESNPQRKFCPDLTNSGIHLNNIGGLFILILIGIGIAFTTLVYEYFYFTLLRKTCLFQKQVKIIDIRREKVVDISEDLP